MSEDVNTAETTDISFEEALEQSLKPIQNGDCVKGVVVSVAPNEIQIDLGTKQAGYLTASEFSNDPNVKLDEVIKVGDELEVQVVRVNDVEGTIMVSRRRVELAKAFNEIVEAFNDGKVLSGTIVEAVNGGVIADYKGIKIFIPASQSNVPRDGDLNEIVNTPANFKIIDVQTGRRRKLIGSIRNATREIRSENESKVFSDIEIGKKYNGKVKSFTTYGAFVNIGGVDGMIHISELSWNKIRHPSEILNIGDTVEVYIKDFDKETKRISLGYKNNDENPYVLFNSKYREGDIVDVKIVKLMPFGAFAEIIPGIDGLIHISQISNKRVNKIYDFLKAGEVVKTKITLIDTEKNKISLSIKTLLIEETEKADKAAIEELKAKEVQETPETAAETEKPAKKAAKKTAVKKESEEKPAKKATKTAKKETKKPAKAEKTVKEIKKPKADKSAKADKPLKKTADKPVKKAEKAVKETKKPKAEKSAKAEKPAKAPKKAKKSE